MIYHASYPLYEHIKYTDAGLQKWFSELNEDAIQTVRNFKVEEGFTHESTMEELMYKVIINEFRSLFIKADTVYLPFFGATSWRADTIDGRHGKHIHRLNNLLRNLPKHLKCVITVGTNFVEAAIGGTAMDRCQCWVYERTAGRQLSFIPYPADYAARLVGSIQDDRPISKMYNFSFVGHGKRDGQPVRSSLIASLTKRKDSFCRDTSTETITPTAYAMTMRNSRFCFAPRGDTESCKHLYNAIAAGCIPILLSDAWKLPFSEIIPWSQLIIRLPEASVYNSSHFQLELDKLISMKDSTYRDYKTQLIKWRKALIYDPSDAGQLLRQSLRSADDAKSIRQHSAIEKTKNTTIITPSI